MKLKSNKIFLLKNTPEDVLATHALASESFQKIADAALPTSKPELPFYTVWISREEELHDFLYQIPDLAWEMLEYAEEPLEMIYPHRKFSSPRNESAQQPIAIRLVKGRKLQGFVRRHGPLLAFRSVTKQNHDIADETHDLQEKESAYSSVKSMKLFADGSFTFIR